MVTITTSREPRGNAAVERYILPNEQEKLKFGQHPAVIIQPAVIAAGSVLVAAIISIGPSSNKGAESVVWILALFLACRAIYLFALWLGQFWVITNARIVIISGFFTRTVTSYDLTDLRYCAFQRNLGGRLLGYGTIVFNAGKLNRTVIDFIPYSEQIYLEIYGILSPELMDADGS